MNPLELPHTGSCAGAGTETPEAADAPEVLPGASGSFPKKGKEKPDLQSRSGYGGTGQI